MLPELPVDSLDGGVAQTGGAVAGSAELSPELSTVFPIWPPLLFGVVGVDELP